MHAADEHHILSPFLSRELAHSMSLPHLFTREAKVLISMTLIFALSLSLSHHMSLLFWFDTIAVVVIRLLRLAHRPDPRSHPMVTLLVHRHTYTRARAHPREHVMLESALWLARSPLWSVERLHQSAFCDQNRVKPISETLTCYISHTHRHTLR